MAQALALMRALDQARQISDDKIFGLTAFVLSDPQDRRLGGEGIIGDLGPHLDTAQMSVLLPALGKPISPTSAMIFNSRRTMRTWPACGGVTVRLWLLPLPPSPPLTTVTLSPCTARSRIKRDRKSTR